MYTMEKQWKIKKIEIWWAYPKKYIPSANTLYKEDLSNITFNYLRVDSLNYLYHSITPLYLFISSNTYFPQK